MKTTIRDLHTSPDKEAEFNNIPDDFPDPNDKGYWSPPPGEWLNSFMVEDYLYDVDQWFKKYRLDE